MRQPNRYLHCANRTLQNLPPKSKPVGWNSSTAPVNCKLRTAWLEQRPSHSMLAVFGKRNLGCRARAGRAHDAVQRGEHHRRWSRRWGTADVCDVFVKLNGEICKVALLLHAGHLQRHRDAALHDGSSASVHGLHSRVDQGVRLLGWDGDVDLLDFAQDLINY